MEVDTAVGLIDANLAKALAKCLHSPLIGHALQFGLLFVQKTCIDIKACGKFIYRLFACTNFLVNAIASSVKQYVFTYLSECNQLVVQLIPVEAMVHWSVIALVVWNSNYFFLNFCMGNTEVRRGSGVTVFVDRACIILARDIFELSPTPDTYVGF